jgi:hypothetical protein
MGAAEFGGSYLLLVSLLFVNQNVYDVVKYLEQGVEEVAGGCRTLHS